MENKNNINAVVSALNKIKDRIERNKEDISDYQLIEAVLKAFKVPENFLVKRLEENDFNNFEDIINFKKDGLNDNIKLRIMKFNASMTGIINGINKQLLNLINEDQKEPLHQ